MTIDQVIAAYVKLRDKRDALKKEQAAAMAPINESLYKLQLWLQKSLQDSGQTSAKTAAGTAFLQTDVSVAIEDFDVILAFIKTHDLWAMLEKRVSKSVVTDYIESTKEVPPGITVKSEISCHIRRS
jgi:hypothetical protein